MYRSEVGLFSTAWKQVLCCRSLIAAYELLKLGFTKVSVLKGGFSEWKRNERWGSIPISPQEWNALSIFPFFMRFHDCLQQQSFVICASP